MPTNFKPKRLKPKLDFVEKAESWLHRLHDTDRFQRFPNGSAGDLQHYSLWRVGVIGHPIYNCTHCS